MLDINGNISSKHTDMRCGGCNAQEKFQALIMEQCLQFKTTTQQINLQSRMNKERTITKT